MRTDAVAAVQGGAAAARSSSSLFSASHPIHEVHFRGPTSTTAAGSYVVASPEQLARRCATSSSRRRRPSRGQPGDGGGKAAGKRQASAASRSGPTLDGLVNAAHDGRGPRDPARRELKFPVYYPTLLTSARPLRDAERNARAARVYTHYRDRAPDGKMHDAYRLVVASNGIDGEYYGVQGTTWTDPPILDNRPATRARSTASKLQLFYDGNAAAAGRLADAQGVYWVSEHAAARRSRTTRCSRSPARSRGSAAAERERVRLPPSR